MIGSDGNERECRHQNGHHGDVRLDEAMPGYVEHASLVLDGFRRYLLHNRLLPFHRQASRHWTKSVVGLADVELC